MSSATHNSILQPLTNHIILFECLPLPLLPLPLLLPPTHRCPSDMIVHPEFLVRTLGHFYLQTSPGGPWVLKDRAVLLQTPQVRG